jgi:Pyruvate/2-oxoacid:ferredoxin oxidoreductase delta subunit
VADVIPLEKKLKLAAKEKSALIKRRKIRAVQKVFQCTHCAFKCEKCGTQIERDHKSVENGPRHRVPYRFCGGCLEEYLDYIERLQGNGDPDCYWHNDAWMALWRTWIDYQGSMDRYLNSKEFTQLMQDLKQTGPGE